VRDAELCYFGAAEKTPFFLFRILPWTREEAAAA